MRALVVSNLYPPHHIGGYELGCRDVVSEMRRRGHEILVLTSTYGTKEGKQVRDSEDQVCRWLELDWGWPSEGLPRRIFRLCRKEWVNQKRFCNLVHEFAPDLVYLWNPAGISLSLVAIAQQINLPVAYFVSDEWLARWSPEQDSWARLWSRRASTVPKQLAKRITQRALQRAGLLTAAEPVRGENIQFASLYLKTRTSAVHSAASAGRVVHWGIATDRFKGSNTSDAVPAKLLYVGQVIEHKGVHTAIEAVRLLKTVHGSRNISLDIVGGSTVPEYVTRLKRAVRDAGLEDVIRFRGAVDREELADIYRDNHILIFPSAWAEPFSITLLEGMSSGLAVVGTATGGSGEILEHGNNALLFSVGDAEACAAQLHRLLSDPALYRRLCEQARETVERSFTFQVMADEIESALQSTYAGAD